MPETTLAMVDATVIPNGGDGLVFDEVKGLYVPSPGGAGGGASELDHLTDVSSAGATTGQILRFVDGEWVADNETPFPNLDLDDLGDVDTTTTVPTEGQVLKFLNGTWVPAADSDTDTVFNPGAVSINAFSDVDTQTTAPSVGQVLKWDGTNWVAGNDLQGSGGTGGGVTELDGLDDVVLTAPAVGEVLRFNGSAWVDARVALDDLSDVNLTTNTVDSGDYLSFNGTEWIAAAFPDMGARTLDELLDVSVTNLLDGQMLEYVAADGVFKNVNPPDSGSPWEAGDIKPSARATPSPGWLLCNGASVAIATYPDLYEALGGAGSPFGGVTATHFQVPDYRGRGGIGAGTGDHASATARARGQKVGTEKHLLVAGESALKEHDVTVKYNTNSNTGGGGNQLRITNITSAGTDTGTANVPGQDAATGHNNMQPSLVHNYFIKT